MLKTEKLRISNTTKGNFEKLRIFSEICSSEKHPPILLENKLQKRRTLVIDDDKSCAKILTLVE